MQRRSREGQGTKTSSSELERRSQEFLRLAFDPERAGDPACIDLDDTLYSPLFQLDGVKKVWVEHLGRNGRCLGWYSWFPNGCDEAHFLEPKGMDARHWPEPD